MNQLLISLISHYKAKNAVELLKEEYLISGDIILKTAASRKLIDYFENTIAEMPNDLKALYIFSNGFSSSNLEILSIFDKTNQKKTWDSINKAEKSLDKGFAYHHDHMENFCVFGRLAPPNYAVAYKRDNGSFCFESEAAIIETDFNLRDFLAICLQTDKLPKQISECL